MSKELAKGIIKCICCDGLGHDHAGVCRVCNGTGINLERTLASFAERLTVIEGGLTNCTTMVDYENKEKECETR